MDLPPLLTRDDIAGGLEAVRAEHGPWEFHNVQLPYGLFTVGPEPKGDNHRALKFLQLAADTLQRGGLRPRPPPLARSPRRLSAPTRR